MTVTRQTYRKSDKISLEHRVGVNRSSMKAKHPIEYCVTVIVTLRTELMIVSAFC